jgi:NAD(P)-dependent dehydrogenase (short-subunit alcohol dehydrogenase family)
VPVVAITGSAGGMGVAIRRRLESAGTRVVGIDRHDAEVVADLSTPEGRRSMVVEVERACDGALDGLVAAAGIQKGPAPTILSVNYFGAVATLHGLRPFLARGTDPSAVAVSSNSTTTQPGYPLEVAELCVRGDEEGACRAIGEDALGAYAASKLALAHWSRRQATTAPWIGAGIRLNVIAPGFIDTPMTSGMWEFVSGLGELFPIPAARAGTAEEIAGLVAYLLSSEAGFFCGSFITMDGGSEAALRADDWPSPNF